MLTLAIDTATKICSVALCKDREVLAEYTINRGMTHSEGLLPQLEQLFTRSGISKKEIELLAVSMGPGSFTGLRIGLATAEAMAYAFKVYIHGVNTLKALAYNLPVDGAVLSPVIDAQKGNYYQAIYKWEGGVLRELMPLAVVKAAKVLENMAGTGCDVVILGECAKLIKNGLPAFVKTMPDHLALPRASSVAFAAMAEFDPAADRKIFGLEPYYIRRSEAEELWEKKHA